MTKKIIVLIIFFSFISCAGSSFSIKKEKKEEKLTKKTNKEETIKKIKNNELPEISISIEYKKEDRKDLKEIKKNEQELINDSVTFRKIPEINLSEKKISSLGKRKQKYPYFDKVIKPGEYLEFSIQYLGIKGGTGILTVKDIVDLNGKKAFHIVSKALSAKAISWIFKVEDKIESYLAVDKLHSLKIKKRIREGSYKRNDDITFLQKEQKVEKITNNKKKEYFKTKPHVFDILSAFYMFRCMDLKVGGVFTIPVYDVEKSYDLKIKVISKETVEVPVGKFKAYKIKPILESMGLFKHKGDIFIWISADEKRIPLILKSSIKIGSVYGVLEKYEVKKWIKIFLKM